MKLWMLLLALPLVGCGSISVEWDRPGTVAEVGCDPVELTVNGVTKGGLNSIAVTDDNGNITIVTEPDFPVEFPDEGEVPPVDPPEPGQCFDAPTGGYSSGPDLDLSQGKGGQLTFTQPTVRKVIIPEDYTQGLQFSLGASPQSSGYMSIGISKCRNYEEGQIQTCSAGGSSTANLRIFNSGSDVPTERCEGVGPGEWYVFFGRQCSPGSCSMVQVVY